MNSKEATQELYRVCFVTSGLRRKRVTATADMTAYYQQAGYAGIRVTSVRPATAVEITRYNAEAARINRANAGSQR